MLDHAFIHPLLGTDGAWSCYLVEFAPDAPGHDLLVNLDTSPLIDEFDHRSLWFFPADVAGSDLRQLGERAIPVFASSAAPNNTAALDQQESELRKAKRKLGLLASAGHKLPGAGCWDYLLIAASHARSLAPIR
jgi:EAL and modified HD-GYP domain-containing signal transduction protein